MSTARASPLIKLVVCNTNLKTRNEPYLASSDNATAESWRKLTLPLLSLSTNNGMMPALRRVVRRSSGMPSASEISHKWDFHHSQQVLAIWYQLHQIQCLGVANCQQPMRQCHYWQAQHRCHLRECQAWENLEENKLTIFCKCWYQLQGEVPFKCICIVVEFKHLWNHTGFNELSTEIFYNNVSRMTFLKAKHWLSIKNAGNRLNVHWAEFTCWIILKMHEEIPASRSIVRASSEKYIHLTNTSMCQDVYTNQTVQAWIVHLQLCFVHCFHSYLSQAVLPALKQHLYWGVPSEYPLKIKIV